MSTVCIDDCKVGVYAGGFASQIFDVSRGMKYHLFYHYYLAQVLKRLCHCFALTSTSASLVLAIRTNFNWLSAAISRL